MEVRLMRDPDCIFCKIAAGEIPSAVVFENESAFAFLDVGPLAEGHVLVIPRDHYARVTDLPESVCAQIATVIPRLGRALMEVTQAAGFNLLANNGEAAGQVVQHVHFHLVPRVPKDGLGYRWNAGKYEPGQAERIAADYRSALTAE
jgi:histidine triad (HIT) family protein